MNQTGVSTLLCQSYQLLSALSGIVSLVYTGILQHRYLPLPCNLILVPRNTTFFRKIVVNHQSVLFVMHLLKILNTVFCTAQVLLFCLKSCLPQLHIYSETDGIRLPMRKHCLFLNGISHNEFDTTGFFSVCPVIYFFVQPFLKGTGQNTGVGGWLEHFKMWWLENT